MRNKNYFLLFVGLLFASISFAQVTVKGTVTDKQDNSPLPGVTVVIQNTTKGTVTDINGKYEIQLDSLGQTLEFKFVGMETVTMVATSNTVNVGMSAGVNLEAVTVTALGLEVDKDKVGSAQSTIDGAALQDNGETRLINNMSGKTAGVNIIQSTGDPGAGSKIQIRGASSITGDNQPLVIIDGVPMDNGSYSGAGSNYVGSGGGVTQQSRLNDLNPNDIESMEVIRGASAAALWGSRALNGVIVITTKKGKQGAQKTFDVRINSAVAFDQVNRKIDLNETYGQGISMLHLDNSNTGFVRALSWGDKIADRKGGTDDFITDPNAAGYNGYFIDNVSGNKYYATADGDSANPHGGKNSREVYSPYDQLFKTGVTFDNSVSISSGGPKGTVYFSVSDLNQNGIIIANSNYRKNTVRLSGSSRLNDKWNVSGSGQYIKTSSNRVQMGSNLNGLFLGGLRNPADFNMEDYEGTYYGADGSINKNVPRAFRNQLGKNPGYGYDNPLWMMRRSPSSANVNRMIGKGEITYSPMSWLSVTARGGWDFYTDQRDDYFHPHSSGENNGGRYAKEKYSYLQLNGDIFARGTFKLNDDSKLNALVGFNVNDRRDNTISSDARTFINPFAPPLLNNADPATVASVNNTTRILTNGYYGTFGFSFWDELFVDLTGRYDISSTLPEDNMGVFYPGLSVAYQLNKYLPKSMFVKVRGAIGQVGRTPTEYTLRTGLYSPTNSLTAVEQFGYSDGWGSAIFPSGYGGGFALSSNAGNPNLKPEIKTEWELGFDSRFLNGRAYANFTYYNNETKDLLLSVDVAHSTGFGYQESNAARITNQGVEIEVGGIAMKKENFQWSIDGNFTRNKNEVVEISGVDNVFLGGFTDGSSRAVVGHQLGVLYGSKWERDESGNQVLDANGFPVMAADNGVIGDPNPDFRFGIGNTFKYKNWEAYILFDAAVGMDMWNGTKGALAFFGRAGYTDVTTTVSASDAASLVNFDGVTVEDYYPYAKNADGSYTIRGEVKNFGGGNVIVDESWYLNGPGSGFTGPSEQFVEDGSWYRIREVRIAYTLRKEKMNGFLGLQQIKFYGTVNNAFLFTSYTGNDPDQTLTGAGNNGFGLDYFQNPSTRTYRFGVNISF